MNICQKPEDDLRNLLDKKTYLDNKTTKLQPNLSTMANCQTARFVGLPLLALAVLVAMVP